MQSRATHAVLFYGLSFLIVLYAWLKNTNWKKQITVANIFLLLCFLVYLLAPGNANRMSPEGFDMAHYIHEYRREIQNILISFNLAKFGSGIHCSSGHHSCFTIIRLCSRIEAKYVVLRANPFAYLLFVLAHGILFVYATGYAAWNRVFAMHTFLFVIVCGFYAYTAYTKWAPDSTKNKIMKLGVPLALAFLMFKMYQPLSHQLQLGKSFA